MALGTSATSALVSSWTVISQLIIQAKRNGIWKALRNLLTTLTLVFVAVGLGVKQKILNNWIFEADAEGNADNKQMNLHVAIYFTYCCQTIRCIF